MADQASLDGQELGESIDAPDTPADDGGGCPVLRFTVRPPDVIIAFDQTGYEASFGTTTEFEATQSLMRDLVIEYQDRVRFGYEEFPKNTYAAPCEGGGKCCASDVLVSPALHAYDAIYAAFRGVGGRTSVGMPTGDALGAIRAFYGQFADGVDERFVLLTTDQPPNCGMTVPYCDAATAEAQGLHDMGVETAFVGIGAKAANDACFEAMGAAGGFPRPGQPSYYQAGDRATLRTHLNNIIEDILSRSCHLNLATPPDDPARVSLLFDGAAVPVDTAHAAGWDYDAGSATAITIYGSYCQDLHAGRIKAVELHSVCE